MKAIEILLEFETLVKSLKTQDIVNPEQEALRIQKEKYREMDTEVVELQ